MISRLGKFFFFFFCRGHNNSNTRKVYFAKSSFRVSFLFPSCLSPSFFFCNVSLLLVLVGIKKKKIKKKNQNLVWPFFLKLLIITQLKILFKRKPDYLRERRRTQSKTRNSRAEERENNFLKIFHAYSLIFAI